MLTFGLSFLGWYLLACMRTLVRWVMCLGVNKEFIFTGVSLSDTGILDIAHCTGGPATALWPINICGIEGNVVTVDVAIIRFWVGL
jgi:hypothetical protein